MSDPARVRAERIVAETAHCATDEPLIDAIEAALDEAAREKDEVYHVRHLCCDDVEALRERVAGLEGALRPFAAFAEKLVAKPLGKVGDEFYGIHVGTEWEASLRFSDLHAARAALGEQN